MEIFHNGNWGTVCDDNWDMNEARVVCRQLGFSDAVSSPSGAHFGAGSGRIWLDNLFCSGSEISIADCPPRAWGVEDCDHSEDASVICLSKPSSSSASLFVGTELVPTNKKFYKLMCCCLKFITCKLRALSICQNWPAG